MHKAILKFKKLFRMRLDKKIFDAAAEITLNNMSIEARYGLYKRLDPKIDLKSITRKKEKKIIHKTFWGPFRFRDIKDAKLRNKVFDINVHLGYPVAIRLLQEAITPLLEEMSYIEILDVDGTLGNQTLFFLNDLDPEWVYRAYITRVSRHYRSLTVANPDIKVHLKSWLNRLHHS